MTTTSRDTERRVLYLLLKNGGQAPKSVISQGMSRTPAKLRDWALSCLEDLQLISSAKVPGQKGRGGRHAIQYWLTEQGRTYCADEIAAGRMTDPAARRSSTASAQ